MQQPRFWRQRKTKVGCDMMRNFACLAVRADSEFYADGVHLSTAGMEMFCKVLQNMVKVRPCRCMHMSITLNSRRLFQGKDLVISDSTLCVVDKARCNMPKTQKNKQTENGCQERPARGGDAGSLAESLLGVTVRPAWGKGFGWGGFARHLWKQLPKKAHMAETASP